MNRQVPKSDVVFLDATPQEEAACPDRLYLFFNSSLKLCGMRMEGGEGLDAERVRPLLEVSFAIFV
jgi:exosome complex component RRP42